MCGYACVCTHRHTHNLLFLTWVALILVFRVLLFYPITCMSFWEGFLSWLFHQWPTHRQQNFLSCCECNGQAEHHLWPNLPLLLNKKSCPLHYPTFCQRRITLLWEQLKPSDLCCFLPFNRLKCFFTLYLLSEVMTLSFAESSGLWYIAEV